MNGAVEAANKNIKKIIGKMTEIYKEWHEKLPFALYAYRTSVRTSTEATLFSLVYEMEAVLPIKVEIPSLRVLMESKLEEAEWVRARYDQLNLIEEKCLKKCLQDWGIKGKVCSISVDNTSYNDAAVRMLKDSLSFHKKLPLNGKLFHVRCCENILKLLVHDGLFEIEDIIDNVRESVKYITASTVRLTMINDIVKQLQLPNKRLILDCCTRWNATYAMVLCVLEFKDVFPHFHVICSEEETLRQLCIVWNSLYELYKEYVDEYPTTNVDTSMENDVQESGASNAFTASRIGKGKVMTERSKFERYIRSVGTVDNVMSELDIYLEE
ncbi:zinc finger BED domain-containing protein RICESLEEPER 3-like [Gossypium hirsutum]|uniref:Zinc finger BED domain-containing protein RICESLEEPER 3-like n=1 Tax=Gossypium hirsutum TaxID=3635 RepID=A0ABM2YMY5_GOSHI|nr:zinc finger BED domain-containing protein RICESLEEPER 3-like [Gossypium hirsutum]